MAKMSPGQYVREVKAEMKKITWPSRHETTVSVIAVFIMVFIASLFLFMSDQILSFLVNMVLSIGV